jgi:hypothetical protein
LLTQLQRNSHAAAVSVRVGSSTPASITVSLDKASYAPGEAVTASISVLDASGLAVADGVYNNIFATGGISANYTNRWMVETTTVTTVGWCRITYRIPSFNRR